MNKSESIANLAKALSIAQGQMGGAVKGKANPFFKSVYADLSSVVEAVREPLTSNGISFVQVTHPSERNEIIIETVSMHESGEWLSGTLAMPVSKADAQGYGSAITYAKRYGLQGLLGVPSEDDDGNAASKGVKNAKTGLHESSKTIGQAATETLTDEQLASVRLWADSIIDAQTAGDSEYDMYRIYEDCKTKHAGEVEFVTAVWNQLDSKIRSSIKKTGVSIGKSIGKQ
jgi:hypothetical protein